MFNNILVYGDWNHSYQAILTDCVVETSANFNGMMKDCSIEGNISLSVSGETSIIDCAGGETVLIDMVAGVATTLNIKRYAGGINLVNCDQSGDVASLSMDVGRIVLDSTCVGGNIKVGGSAVLTNNSVGSVVNDLSLINPVTQNMLLQEILGLSQSNFLMSNQTYTVSGSLETCIIRTFETAADTTSQTNPIATYDVNASYDGNGLLNSYKVTKQ